MAVVRSIFYIVGFGALSFGLMSIVTPNETEINKKLLEGKSETAGDLLKKRQTFVDVLKSAANEKSPMYRQTREEIEKSLKK